MLMEDDRPVLLCGVYEPGVFVVPGSELRACEGCGVTVTSAPSSRHLIEREHARVVCNTCGINLLAQATCEGGVAILPGALQEILDLSARFPNWKR